MAVKDVVVAEAAGPLPPAALVILQVSRLRPKGSDEARFETAQLADMFAYLQGAAPAAPSRPPQRWPACINLEFYLKQEGVVLACKARHRSLPTRARCMQCVNPLSARPYA